MALAWLIGFPLLTLIATILSLRVIGMPLRTLLNALFPAGIAGAAMVVVVTGADHILPPLRPFAHLIALVAIGAATYGATLHLTARSVLSELLGLLRFRQITAAAAT